MALATSPRPAFFDAALADLEAQVQAGIEFHEEMGTEVCSGCLRLVELIEELAAEVDPPVAAGAGEGGQTT